MPRLFALAAVLALAACTADSQPAPPPPPPVATPASPTPTADPSPAEAQTVAAAKAAVQRFWDRASAGDFAGAWDLYSAQGKKAIDQDTFVKVETACRPTGTGVDVVDARLTSPTRALVVVRALAASATTEAVYEGGRWLVVPGRKTMQRWKAGTVKGIIERMRAADACDPNAP